MKKTLLKLKSIAVLSVLFTGVVSAQSFVGSTVVNSQNNMGIDVVTYPAGDSVVITMTGPSNVWFGFGFGGSSMNGTYSIICDGAGNVSERRLGNHNSGSQLSSSFTSTTTSVSGSVRTTVVKRSMTGMNSSYFTFPGGGTGFSVIWAFGFGSSLNSHTKRGATALSFNAVNLGMDENMLSKAVQVYPNPANEKVSIDLGSVYEDVELILMDLSGRELVRKEYKSMDKTELDVDQFSGIYVIHIITGNGEHTTQRLLID